MDFFERVQNFLLTLIFSASTCSHNQKPAWWPSTRSMASLDRWMTSSLIRPVDNNKRCRSRLFKPVMPNMIDAGGLTVKPATGQLPAEIVQFAESAEKGLIIFSFGSASNKFPSVITKKFLSTFDQLPGYRIIWRFGSDKETVLPDNVMALEWLPQNELLAHPKTKLFITHCGNNGQFEALYHAVPMIGFPLHRRSTIQCETDGVQRIWNRDGHTRIHVWRTAEQCSSRVIKPFLQRKHWTGFLDMEKFSPKTGWKGSLVDRARHQVWIETSEFLRTPAQPSPVLLIRRDGVSFNRGRLVSVCLGNDQISGEDDPEPRKRTNQNKKLNKSDFGQNEV